MPSDDNQRRQRLFALDQAGRRCDGKSRRCLNEAVFEYHLRVRKGDGTLGEPEIRRSCYLGRHTAPYEYGGMYEVESVHDIPESEAARAKRERREEREREEAEQLIPPVREPQRNTATSPLFIPPPEV